MIQLRTKAKTIGSVRLEKNKPDFRNSYNHYQIFYWLSEIAALKTIWDFNEK